MALSQKDIQARYRGKIKDGKLRRIELVIDRDTDQMIEYLSESLASTRKGAIIQAIRALYKEQRKFDEDYRSEVVPKIGFFS